MTWLEALAILAAGIGAGTINTIVGSGSLVTFPTLVALGYSPIVANVTNTVGLVPGSISGAVGYRRELDGQLRRLLWLGTASLIGGLGGAILLLNLDDDVFETAVPILIGLGCALVIIQPRLSAWMRGRRGAGHAPSPHGSWLTLVAIGLASVYGGYFGAAQGVIYMAVLGLGIDDALQRLNATKNVLAALVNGAAAAFFCVAADVDWWAAAALAVGATIGGQLGATVGRRLPDWLLRGFIVVVGVVAIVAFAIS
ncbi:MAG TPA: sulfite exporter TauE/SafE family protein, partial [Nocardioidaceae bacterium]|nr:sulfite exporter TauE/SafE family protein [Nocardioidaceae bacterium]